MRALLAALPLILLGTGAQAQDWTTISLGTSADLNAIEKTSFSQRYVVGDSGFVARSTDGTQTTWSTINVGTSVDLLAVHQPSSGQAWVSGDGGVVRRLIGGNWEGRNIPNGSEDFVIFTQSSGASYAGGTGGSLYRTLDGGDTWEPQTSGTSEAIRDGLGSITSQAICVGDGGTILKTLDGGHNWTPKPSGTTEDLHAYRDVGNGGIVVGGAGGAILRSADGGETWSPIVTGTTATIYDIDTSGQNANYVLAVGEGGTVLLSIDAGLSWCFIDSGTSTDLFACDMVLNSTWVVAGAGGLMLRTENMGGGCLVGVNEPQVATGYQLSGPQPLAGSGRFELQLDRGQRVRAHVVDVSGRMVARVLDDHVAAGERRALTLDARRWPAGIYFLRVVGDTFSETRKVSVVR